MITKHHKGFTVLEFLIVLAIIAILISIALAGLGRSREKAEDERRVSELRTVSLGIEEFHQACGTYPQSLNQGEVCEGITGDKTLNDFIPDLRRIQADPNIQYAPLTYSQANDECTGFHIAVQLKNITDPIKTGDQNYNSINDSDYQCGSSGHPPFDGTELTAPGLFDMHR